MHIVICMDYGNAKSICTYYGDAELWKLHCNGVIRIINIFYRRKKIYVIFVDGSMMRRKVIRKVVLRLVQSGRTFRRILHARYVQ